MKSTQTLTRTILFKINPNSDKYHFTKSTHETNDQNHFMTSTQNVTRSLVCSLAQFLGIYFLFCVNLLNVSQATMFYWEKIPITIYIDQDYIFLQHSNKLRLSTCSLPKYNLLPVLQSSDPIHFLDLSSS